MASSLLLWFASIFVSFATYINPDCLPLSSFDIEEYYFTPSGYLTSNGLSSPYYTPQLDLNNGDISIIPSRSTTNGDPSNITITSSNALGIKSPDEWSVWYDAINAEVGYPTYYTEILIIRFNNFGTNYIYITWGGGCAKVGGYQGIPYGCNLIDLYVYYCNGTVTTYRYLHAYSSTVISIDNGSIPITQILIKAIYVSNNQFQLSSLRYKVLALKPGYSRHPTPEPTLSPTPGPSDITLNPTINPTTEPTIDPTTSPTLEPTTYAPTVEPTTREPTTSPTYYKYVSNDDDDESMPIAIIVVIVVVVLGVFIIGGFVIQQIVSPKKPPKNRRDHENDAPSVQIGRIKENVNELEFEDKNDYNEPAPSAPNEEVLNDYNDPIPSAPPPAYSPPDDIEQEPGEQQEGVTQKEGVIQQEGVTYYHE